MITYHSNSFNLASHKIWLKLFVVLIVICLEGCASPSSKLIPATSAPTEAPTITPSPAPTMIPGDSEHSVNVDGKDRYYELHIPPGVTESASVVIVLHDASHTISQTRSWTKFDTLADNNGIVLVYPKGLGNSWNGGGCCGMAVEDKVDDVNFVRRILSDLERSIPVNHARIYAAGFGNGAMMAYRLACEMSDTFAAIAAVEGPLFYDQCQPEHAVAIIHIHGLSDPRIPYSGDGTIPPVEEGVQKWIQWDGCSGTPRTDKTGAINHIVYPDCKSNAAVELYTIDGLEHAWPVQSGSGEEDFPATQTIWDFFITHARN